MRISDGRSDVCSSDMEGIRNLPTASRESKARRDPMKPKKMDDGVRVSGQLRAADIDSAAPAGFKMIVNNRPDGEDPDHTAKAERGHRPEAAGVHYRNVPVSGRKYNHSSIRPMAHALHPTTAQVHTYGRHVI